MQMILTIKSHTLFNLCAPNQTHVQSNTKHRYIRARKKRHFNASSKQSSARGAQWLHRMVSLSQGKPLEAMPQNTHTHASEMKVNTLCPTKTEAHFDSYSFFFLAFFFAKII